MPSLLPGHYAAVNVRKELYVTTPSGTSSRGAASATYLIGVNGDRSNIEVLRVILCQMGRSEDDFDWVCDHPGHERDWDPTKLERELGWRPLHTDFREGLVQTIEWYRMRESWWRPAKGASEARYAAQGQ